MCAQVVAALDGNTLEVLQVHHRERIRFHSIDCPERGLAYGNKAKQKREKTASGLICCPPFTEKNDS